LVDVPDAISLRALAGTPFNVLDSAASSQHARVPRTSGTGTQPPFSCELLRVVSVHERLLAQGCIDEQECRKATDDCNLRFDVGPAVVKWVVCSYSPSSPLASLCSHRDFHPVGEVLSGDIR
jgi:hypothetical protein